MSKGLSATVIIAFYKRLDFLDKILEGLNNQTAQDFEVIIAEDDNSPEALEFILQKRKVYPFPIIHVSQEDKGFRKNRILNEALRHASSGIILFLDGDSIPHPAFVWQYCRNIEKGTACFGRRVMLGEKFTSSLLREPGIRSLKLSSLLFSDSRRVEESMYIPFYRKYKNEYRGIWGCNWGVRLEDLIEINGFDEDYIQASVGEDNDIEWRLRQNEVKFLSMKHRAIVYHMYHKENYNSEATKFNLKVFEGKKKEGRIKCINGLTRFTN